jgi:hypothetical protein
VQGSVQRRNTHNVNGMFGKLSPAYKLGFSRDIDLGDRTFAVNGAGFNESLSEQTTWRGSSGVSLFTQINLDLTYQRSNLNSRTTTGGVGRVQRDTIWPEIRFNWGTVHERIPLLNKVFTEFRPASSTYRKQTLVSGTTINPEETTTTTTSWQPLLSIQGTLRGGWRTNYSADVSSSATDSRRAGSVPILTTRSTVNHRLSFNKAFRRQAGQRTREINVNLDITYGKTTTRTESTQIVENSNDNLSLRTGATVPFTGSISGTFQVNFAQDRRLNEGYTRRSLGLSFSTGFRF